MTDFWTSQPWFLPTVIILGIWSMVWKGFALYKAGASRDKAWFIVLFLVNTLGILEIFYLFVIRKKNKS